MIHFILFMLLGMAAYQSPLDDPFLIFLEQLELDRADVYMDGVVMQEMSDDSVYIAAVIPVLVEKSDDYFVLDAYILLADRESADIKAVFYEEKAWTSDAYFIRQIEIESEFYPVAPETKAFGVVLHYQSSSRVNRLDTRELSLFVEDEGDLNRVLKDFYLMSSEIIIDGECDSSTSSVSRSIEVTNQRTNNFFDLKVLEEAEQDIITQENCTFQNVMKSREEFTLTFRDGRYQPGSVG